MGTIDKISGVSTTDIVKASGVDSHDIDKVDGVAYPAEVVLASKWIVGASTGLLLSASNPEQDHSTSPGATGWGTMVDLGGMNTYDVAYGENASGNKRWVIGTSNDAIELAYCLDDPDALARNFATDPLDGAKWMAIDLSPNLTATTGGPAIAFTNTGGAGGTDRVWVAGGTQVGSTPNAQSIKRSTDGAASWTVLATGDTPGQQQPARSMCYKSGRDWFATNDSDIWGSTDDGATFDLVIEDPGGLQGVFNAMAYDGSSKWVVVGNAGRIGYSTNDWTSGTEATDSGSEGPFGSSHIYGIVYCGGTINKWVACAQGGKIGYSTDGDTWTLAPEPVARPRLNAIATDNTTIVVVANNGKIYTSTTGTSFTERDSGESVNLWSVACDVIGAGVR